MTDKLKPCPFCGKEATTSEEEYIKGRIKKLPRGVGWIGCQRCRVFMDYVHGDRGKRLAIEAWNTRKPIDKVVKQLEELQELGHRNECAGGEAACPVTNCEEHYIQLVIEIIKKGGAE